jgi:hypothetical protein
MVNEIIVEVALALGVSPSVVTAMLSLVTGAIAALGVERLAIARKRFKPPTPERARDTGFVLAVASAMPVAVIAGFGLQAALLVGGMLAGALGLLYVRGDLGNK